MIVTIHLYAAAREIMRRESISLELPIESTVATVRVAVAEQFPALAPLLRRSAIAVNHDYADDNIVLSDSDELAVIPPVSGG